MKLSHSTAWFAYLTFSAPPSLGSRRESLLSEYINWYCPLVSKADAKNHLEDVFCFSVF